MAQAFVRRIFRERRTESTIQVPNEESSINEELVKEVLEKVGSDFIANPDQDQEDSERSFRLANAVNKALVEQVSSVKDHKIVIYVMFSEQWGQGCKLVGKCLWNTNCDRVVSVDISNDKEICQVSAFFSKIPEDSSDEEEVFDD